MGLMFLSGEGYPGCRSCCRYKYQVRKQISCWGCLQSRVQAGSDSVKVLWADPDFPMGTKLYLPGEIPGTAFSNGMMIIGALKLTRSIGLAAQGSPGLQGCVRSSGTASPGSVPQPGSVPNPGSVPHSGSAPCSCSRDYFTLRFWPVKEIHSIFVCCFEAVQRPGEQMH